MTPKSIGRYEIKDELGRGGMATVYRAYDPTFEREVALKVLPREFMHEAQFRTRFEREAKTIAKLEHAAIVPVYDVGEDQGQPYFVMRMMTGGSLSDRMENGPMSLEETAYILERVSSGLDGAHAKGIVHRDLKPGNILFDENGDPFISDFGIAKLTQSQTNVTGGAIIGTPAYMSPEQAQGEEIDSRADIYSLGVIVFEMLAGKQPFESNTPMGVVFKHVTEPIPHILDIKSDLPVSIESVIEKAMAKKPTDRFQNAASFADALSTVARGEIPDLNKTVFQAARVNNTRSRVTSSGGNGSNNTASALNSTMSYIKKQSVPVKVIFVAAGIICLGLLSFLGSKFFTAQSTPTATSTSTATTELTETSTELPVALGVGGADMVGFFHNNNIWVMNIDGSELRQLSDNSSTKTDLQWTVDGDGLSYISDGKCLNIVTLTGDEQEITCFEKITHFESFQVSPDGTKAALTIDRVLYVIPFDKDTMPKIHTLDDLNAVQACATYSEVRPRIVRWSKDSARLAILFLPKASNRSNEVIRVLEIGSCTGITIIDEFPSESTFMPVGYSDTREIPAFTGNGENFLINTSLRNGGYGDLYLYDLQTKEDKTLNPINDSCCYRDAVYSPDGKFILFAYQDIAVSSAQANTIIYYASLEDILSGVELTPLPLPDKFFGIREIMQFVLRTAR